MEEKRVFDLVVVGAGLIGSAAAFHASQLNNISVCLVGPPEPKSRQEAEIFGCWHDEGRLYYRINSLHTWQVVSSKSIERFANLEELTGIKICTETGCIHIHKDKIKLEENIEVSRQLDLEGQDISLTWKSIFPFLNMPEGAYICYEKKCAGHLNPRMLVEAHQRAAEQTGTHLLREVVMTVRPTQNKMHKKIPCMVLRHPFKNLDGGYVVPPIKYPDELKVESVCGDGCITSHTPNKEPYIDIVAEGFGVVLGGNGYGAKCCDELGRLSAHLTLFGEWVSEIPRERVRIIWQAETVKKVQ